MNYQEMPKRFQPLLIKYGFKPSGTFKTQEHFIYYNDLGDYFYLSSSGKLMQGSDETGEEIEVEYRTLRDLEEYLEDNFEISESAKSSIKSFKAFIFEGTNEDSSKMLELSKGIESIEKEIESLKLLRDNVNKALNISKNSQSSSSDELLKRTKMILSGKEYDGKASWTEMVNTSKFHRDQVSSLETSYNKISQQIRDLYDVISNAQEAISYMEKKIKLREKHSKK